MSQITYADPAAPAPDLGVPQAPRTETDQLRVRRAMVTSIIPAAICLCVNFIFFIVYWVPETSRFPGRSGVLTALSPLTSKYLASGGTEIVGLQHEQLGLSAILLLITSLLIAWAARTRYWLARVWLPGPVLLGWIVCIVTIAILVHRNQVRSCLLAVVLMIIWAVAAGAAGWWTMAIDVDSLPPKSFRSGLVVLAAYAILGAPATAVGRWLFAPELRGVANTLRDNQVAMRTAALGLPANAWVYLSGLLVGVTIWLAYQLIPPRRDFRSYVAGAGLVASLVLTAVFGWSVAGPSAVAQAKRIATDSPAGHLSFTCGVWIADPAAAVKHTLVIDGLSCRRLTVYQGYHQVGTETLPGSVSPIEVRTPEAVSIDSGLVSARYEATLAIAMSRRRDGHADWILGLHLLDGSKAWEFGCGNLGELTVRFAGVPGGDHPGMGQVTLPNEVPSVVVGCPVLLKRLDPATGIGIAGKV
jgi:hypothetical protein